MKDRFSYLFKNFSFLLIGNFSSKVLSFLLVPLYTSTLTTTEYGSYDIIYDTILLLIPILSLNITDAIMRFSIDQDEMKKRTVFTVSLKYSLIACFVFVIGLALLRIVSHNQLIKDYFVLTVILFICTLLQQILVQVARGLEMIKYISISGVLGTLICVIANICFLVFLKIGLIGYFLANILALFSQIVFLVIKTNILRLVSIDPRDRKTEKEMLSYSLPLLANTLSWHINSFADKYTIILFEGLSANGIYAVSYKIPAIMTAIQTIFIQSWQLSAVKEYDSPEGKEFVNRTYKVVQTIMVLLCSFTIIATRLLAKILFQAEFYNAWVCVPTLVFYVLFNTLSGTIGGVLGAVKDTKAFMNTSIIGALTNIVLNFILIWWLGILGAAIATAISSVVIWALRVKAVNKHIRMDCYSISAIIQFALLIIQAMLMTFIESYYGYLVQAIIIIGLVFCNKDIIKGWIGSISNRMLN